MRVEFNFPFFAHVRRDPDVQRLVGEAAEEIARECGKGFTVMNRTGKSRARAYIQPGNWEAAKRDQKDAVLLKTAARRGMKVGGP